MIVTSIVGKNKNPANNQYLIIDNRNNMIFKSYNTNIMKFYPRTNIIEIVPEWDCSATTKKYFYKCFSDFCNEQNMNTQDIKNAMKNEFFINSLGIEFLIEFVKKIDI